MENRRFRVAVIGCGSISGNHVSALLHAGQTVAALCDVIPERATRLAARFGLSDVPVYTDYRELLDRERPDAVHICTPHDLHAGMSAEALRREIHVLCEKPAGISEEDLTLLRAAVRGSHASYGVCLQNRYEPNMLRLREMAKDGVAAAFGSVVWRRDADYYRSGDWRGTLAREGGGVLINQALHTLDLLQWVCGMPAYVTANVSNDHLAGKIEVEDTAAILFERADGARYNFFATTAGGADLPVQLSVVLRDGRVIRAANRLLTVDDRCTSPEDPAPGVGKTVWGSGHDTLIADFYGCIREGKPFPIGFDEAERVVQLILAVYRSRGRRIPVGTGGIT